VEISLVLPDVEAAKTSGWGADYRVSLEEKPTRAASWMGPIGENETRSGGVTLTIPAPGYYRAVLAARGETGPKDIDEAHILDSAYRKVWILIDETGGRVTERFEPDQIRAAFQPVPGPRRNRLSRTPVSEAGVGSGFFSAAVGFLREAIGWKRTSVVPLKVIYYSDADEQWMTVKEIYWTVHHLEQVGRGWELHSTESGMTGSSGTFHIDCAADRYDGHLEFRSNQIRVLDAGNPHFEGDTDDDCDSATYIEINAIYHDEAHILMEMDSVADAAESFLSEYRDRLDVQINPYPDTVSFYDRSDDEVHLFDQHVWLDQYSDWVKAHEFTHALHHKGMGGIPSGYDCDNGEEGHAFYTVEDFECAYVEGLADYMGSVVTGMYTSHWESNWWWGVEGEDGSIIEGTVAAFFHDLTDSVAEAHDSVSFPGSYIGDIVETCQVNGSNDATGIDHLIYCFENQIDTLVTNDPDYFPERSADPTSYSESATEPIGWGWSVIRAIWLKNLYDEG